MQKAFVNKSGHEQVHSIENVNIEVVRCFAELFHRLAEIDIKMLQNSQYFANVLNLFYDTKVNVNEKEANTELVLFFSQLIANRMGQSIVV